MSDLTAKFAALESQLAEQQVATQVDLDNMQEQLTALFNELDTVIINNAANARAILQAIGANSPCAPCPTPSLTVPPVDTTGTPIDADKCKRTHAFIHAMMQVFTVLDTMSAFAIPFSPSLISDAIGQVIVALENGDPTPLPSFPEAVQIAGDGINYVAGNFLVGDTLSSLFASVALDMVDAIYSGTTAGDDKAQYAAIISGSVIPSYAKPLMIDAAYNELVSFYFDPASDVNLTGYADNDCSFSLPDITSCVDLSSASTVLGGQTYWYALVPPAYSGNPIFTIGDFFGFTFDVLTIEGATPVLIDYYDLSDAYHTFTTMDASTAVTELTVHTNALGLHSQAGDIGGPFVIRVCPPA